MIVGHIAAYLNNTPSKIDPSLLPVARASSYQYFRHLDLSDSETQLPLDPRLFSIPYFSCLRTLTFHMYRGEDKLPCSISRSWMDLLVSSIQASGLLSKIIFNDLPSKDVIEALDAFGDHPALTEVQLRRIPSDEEHIQRLAMLLVRHPKLEILEIPYSLLRQSTVSIFFQLERLKVLSLTMGTLGRVVSPHAPALFLDDPLFTLSLPTLRRLCFEVSPTYIGLLPIVANQVEELGIWGQVLHDQQDSIQELWIQEPRGSITEYCSALQAICRIAPKAKRMDFGLNHLCHAFIDCLTAFADLKVVRTYGCDPESAVMDYAEERMPECQWVFGEDVYRS
ncbi:hypothetical protein RhiTH_006932 [Rhizoctonia solani]